MPKTPTQADVLNFALKALGLTYPPDWPRCVFCGEPALDGHLTCGRADCNEAEARDREGRC